MSSTVSSGHPLFLNFLFRNLLSIKESCQLICHVSSPFLEPTGLPPHVLSWRTEESLKNAVDSLPKKVLDGMGDVLKQNGIVAGNITEERMEMMLTSALAKVSKFSSQQTEPTQKEQTTFEPFLWKSDGKFHHLKEDYQFPFLTVLQGWMLWWEGNHEKGIPPLCICQPFNVPKTEKPQFSNLKCIVHEVVEAFSSHGICVSVEKIQTMQTWEVIKLGHEGVHYLPGCEKKIQIQRSECTLSTVLKDVQKAKTQADPACKRAQKALKQVSRKPPTNRKEK